MFGFSHHSRRTAPGAGVLPAVPRVPHPDLRFRPAHGSYPLEPRIALSHASIVFGAVQPGQNSAFSGSVARNSTRDYQFQVDESMIVRTTLSGLSANAELVLLNAAKAPLASFASGRANDSFTYAG
jgi:hypothetical protein